MISYTTPSPLTSTISWYKNGHELPNAKVSKYPMWTKLFLIRVLINARTRLLCWPVCGRVTEADIFAAWPPRSGVCRAERPGSGWRTGSRPRRYHTGQWPIRGRHPSHVTCLDQSQAADVPCGARSEDCSGLPGLWLPTPDLLLVQRRRKTVLGSWQVINNKYLDNSGNIYDKKNNNSITFQFEHNPCKWLTVS